MSYTVVARGCERCEPVLLRSAKSLIDGNHYSRNLSPETASSACHLYLDGVGVEGVTEVYVGRGGWALTDTMEIDPDTGCTATCSCGSGMVIRERRASDGYVIVVGERHPYYWDDVMAAKVAHHETELEQLFDKLDHIGEL